MRRLFPLLLSLGYFASCQTEEAKVAPVQVVTEDIPRYWTAFDSIQITTDSLERLAILNRNFIQPATAGQRAMFSARRYRPEEYVDAMLRYPRFYTSIRENTLRAGEFGDELQTGVERLREIYPSLRPAQVYFTMGVFLSPGTTTDSMILIGSEFALTDTTTVTQEFTGRLTLMKDYVANQPIDDLVFLNVHEYVHTQQADALTANLLSQTLREGVAEFVAELAMDARSKAPAEAYFAQNRDAVIAEFTKAMYSTSYRNWLWNSDENPFGVRDLSYSLGRDMAQHFYDASDDKSEAVRQLVELDYGNDDAIASFVAGLDYFPEPLSVYSAARPVVERIERGEVQPDSLARLDIHFAQPMNPAFRGFDYGPLGEDAVLGVEEVVGWSDHGQTFTVRVRRVPGTMQQVTLTERFEDAEGRALKPYLVEWKAEE